MRAIFLDCRVTLATNCHNQYNTVLYAGPLTAAAMCQVVAALQPPGTILVDESLTSGTAYWEASKVTHPDRLKLVHSPVKGALLCLCQQCCVPSLVTTVGYSNSLGWM